MVSWKYSSRINIDFFYLKTALNIQSWINIEFIVSWDYKIIIYTLILKIKCKQENGTQDSAIALRGCGILPWSVFKAILGQNLKQW